MVLHRVGGWVGGWVGGPKHDFSVIQYVSDPLPLRGYMVMLGCVLSSLTIKTESR